MEGLVKEVSGDQLQVNVEVNVVVITAGTWNMEHGT